MERREGGRGEGRVGEYGRESGGIWEREWGNMGESGGIWEREWGDMGERIGEYGREREREG